MDSPSHALNSLFGCLVVLCEHHGVAMSLTLDALGVQIAEQEGMPAAEFALVEAGFSVSRMGLTAEVLQRPDQSFPLLAKRRQGGFVLIIGAKGSNGQPLIGVFDPEKGDAQAQSWTLDLVKKVLTEVALYAAPTHTTDRFPGELVTVGAAPGSLDRNAIDQRRDIMVDIYADAFENIMVHGGIVRIDLASYSPKNKTNDGEPVLELTGRLVMPLEGFVRAFSGIGEVVHQMVEAGVIKPVKAPRASH